ncbi:DMT family transporter [uncultured Aureimonas sp.]|uniref:DMT family transporter n=1 Tax=uncultured Aureimonas sp. TaxID=1604662 RepID=UPI0025E3ECB0|nr:DMT family transporter [uncultured Aureimonas sp.]
MSVWTKHGATAIGLVAIGFWAGLALATVAANGIPPFELLALSFGVAFASGMGVLGLRGREALARLRQPIAPWATAFVAIFLYHALYFFALATVPAARASLIAYLWPLLIVLFAAWMPGGQRLRLHHLSGAALGFLGVAVLFVGRQDTAATATSQLGYLAALGCAGIWAGYSVANRRFADIPSDMLIGICGAVMLAGTTVHLMTETTVMPGGQQWLAILFLGIGPTGLAFLAWDHATKHGDISLLAPMSYLAPLVSTLLLVLTGQAPATLAMGLSAVLIVGGAVLAGRGGQHRTRKAQ